MKICIVGAGSTYTPELVSGLLDISDEVQIDELSLLDIEASGRKLAILSDFVQRMIGAAHSPIRCTPTLDADRAISGSDFVVFQFRAGLLEGRIRDETIPLDHGLIGQETTGVGGMANGLRSFPVVENYLQIVTRSTDDAWVINFTNPSGMLTEFILNYLHYDRCIGLCNVPIKFLLKTAELLKCDRHDVLLRHYGLNHLSWVDRFIVGEVDRTEEVLKSIAVDMKNIAKVDYDSGFIPDLAMLPNPYLKYYYNTRKMLEISIEERQTTGTRGEVIRAIEDELLRLYSEADRTDPPEQLSKRGGFMYSTVATELIRSLVQDDGERHIVNTRNRGAIGGFPADYVMEITATVGSGGPEPLELGDADPKVLGLVTTIKNHERLAIEGYLNRDERLIRHALLIHPLGPDESQLDALWSDLKRANAAWFPDFR
jgi:6-phospho-beta-glucosidase